MFDAKQLSKDQTKALSQVTKWFNTKNTKKSKKPKYITLGGYAGTGKTTLVSVFRQQLNKKSKNTRVAFCAFTGKASMVMRKKLQESNAMYKRDYIGTIHSLIYNPISDEDSEVVEWKLEKKLKFNLIIVDEASMLDENIWRDLLSFNIPILAVGDHGQLPPVNSSFNLMENPTIKLEKIHRQAANNPIIKLATMVRETGNIPVGKYGDKVIKYEKNNTESVAIMEQLAKEYDKDTLLLCGYNVTRVRLNKWIRKVRGITDPTPVGGDRVICLRNNRRKHIYNGMLGDVMNISTNQVGIFENDVDYMMDIKFDDRKKVFEAITPNKQFNNESTLGYNEYREYDLFDFGYALTVHKAQGSQASRIILFEEKFSTMSNDDWKRWLYTAVTRAESELYIFGK